MNKTQIVNEIMRVYDENGALKRELQQLKEGKPSLENENSRILRLDNLLIELGRKEAFRKVFYSWRFDNRPNVEVEADGGQMNFLTFEQWLKTISLDYIDSSCAYLLDYIPLITIKDYFKKELQDTYEDLINKAKVKVLNQAKEAKEVK